MSIKQRPDSPFWWASAVNPATGKLARWSTGEKNKVKAEHAFQTKLREWSKDAEENKDGLRSITLASALAEYVASLGNRPAAKGFGQMTRKTLGAPLRPEDAPLGPKLAGRFHLDGYQPLHALQSRDLELLRRARVLEGNAPQTIHHELKILRAATLYCGSKLSCRVPKALDWPMPKLTTKTRVLSPEEYKALYDYLDPDRPVTSPGRGLRGAQPYTPGGTKRKQRQDVRDLFVALLMTGGRWQEVAKLTWSDLAANGTLLLNSYKTDDTRVVPVPAPMREMLERRFANRDPKEPYVFPGINGGPRAERSSCRPILRAMNDLGFNSPETVAKHGRCVVHSLRHTFATWLSQSGQDIKALGTVLGHRSTKMTERYVHLDAVETANRLGRALEAMPQMDSFRGKDVGPTPRS